MTQEWFKNWFDSPYYDILYSHRDKKEAKLFISALNTIVDFNNTTVLDIGCGNGRHLNEISKYTSNCSGIDLSKRLLDIAREQYLHLKLYYKDMRYFYKLGTFDIVTNFFTSFGYSNENDNYHVVESINNATNKGSILVIDYLNANNLNNTTFEEIKRDNIDFKIKRWSDKETCYKEITILQNEKVINTYTEKVQLLRLQNFIKLFYKFELINLFGDYSLKDFKEDSSRLIMIFRKVK